MLLVETPALHPSLPRAIHTDEMEVQEARGWLRWPSPELLDGLQHNLTPILSEYATDPRRMELVRETARQSVNGLVQRWLQNQGPRYHGHTVVIRFTDEQRQIPSS